MRRTIIALIAGLGLVAIGVGDAGAARREDGRTPRVTKVAASPARLAAPRVQARASATPARAAAGRGEAQNRRGRELGARVAAARGAGASRGGDRFASRSERQGRDRVVAVRGMNRLQMRAVAATTCIRRDARGRCTGARLAGWGAGAAAAATVAPPARSWHAGLPAADGDQTACPEGTMATLARGHSDTIRCMPL